MDMLQQLWTYLMTPHNFMPHGYCYFWNPYLVSLHVISDAFISLAYATIPFTLLYIVAKRKDLPFNWIFLLFGLFIISCGVTHVMGIITLWYAWYWSSGFIKLITAIASVGTAIALIRLIPFVLAFPSQAQLVKANETLAKAELKFRDLLEGVPDALVIIDENEKITMVNRVTCTLFNFTKEELIGKPMEFLLPNFSDDINIHSVLTVELRAFNKDRKSFPVEVSLSPVTTPDGEWTLSTIRDITERKRVEKMKDEFVSIVSHELRTPLTSIHGSVELLAEHKAYNLSPGAANLVSIAKNNSLRLIRLITDILDVQKIASGSIEFQYKKINVNELIEESLKINQPLLDKFSAKVKFIKPAEILYINTDHDRLMQVMSNLISNAAKFSTLGSEIIIQVRKMEKLVRIAITNRGPVISDDFKRNIFKKFSQADSSSVRRHEGTGLGLYITKTLLDRMGGVIAFESSEDQGTTFYFDLPYVMEDEQII